MSDLRPGPTSTLGYVTQTHMGCFIQIFENDAETTQRTSESGTSHHRRIANPICNVINIYCFFFCVWQCCVFQLVLPNSLRFPYPMVLGASNLIVNRDRGRHTNFMFLIRNDQLLWLVLWLK